MKRRYITGFDGLRAIAVVGVMTYHLWPTKLVGGWLGVPLFFVLSGYLITDLLIQEFDRTDKINLLGFYVRRLRRLYPALLTLLVGTSAAIAYLDRPLLYNLRSILFSNLTYTYNLWAVKHGDSYFDSWGGSSPFTHLWSLSIEGQFYFVWPIILLILLKIGVKRIRVSQALFAGSIVSAILMAIFYNSTNINRVYYGTDTRLFAILLGAMLAFIWPSIKLAVKIPTRTKKTLDIVGGISLLIMLVGFFTLNGQSSSTYHGMMYLFTLVMVPLIAVVAHPASFFSHRLNNKVLNYIGTRSYSIYLYQLPIFTLVDHFTNNANTWMANGTKIVLVFAVSEFSYQFIENGWKKIKAIDFSKITLRSEFYKRKKFIISMLTILIILGGYTSAVLSEQSKVAKPKSTLEKQLNKNASKVAAANEKAEVAVKTNASSNVQNSPIAKKYGLTDDEYNKIRGLSITAIGDSVMLDIAPDIQELVPGTIVDGQVGRQASSVPSILATDAQKNKLASTVLLCIGTNGTINENDLIKMMDTIGKDRQVYWVNGYANRSWIIPNNDLLQKMTAKYSNLHVIDWNADVSNGDTNAWLSGDGIHPNPAGAVQYTKLVGQQLAK